jgi:DNA helicase-2/ATP-dependent DNA helicase PcrA
MLTPRALAAALGLPPPTDEQAAVIAAPARSALVVAGAGAGKTETMAARVVWLVATGQVLPEQVLGLTFTRKAAQQLGVRVRTRLRRLAGSRLLDDLDPSGARRAALLAGEPTVATYHAYAGRLVGEHALRLPAEPGARLLGGTGAWQLAHRVVTTWAEDLDVDRVPATVTGYVLALSGELGEHLVDPDTVADHAAALAELLDGAPPGPRQRAEPAQRYRRWLEAQRMRRALVPLVRAFAARKRAERVLDFGDQLAVAARVAAEHPEVGAQERATYRAVLLDEYQDTGHAQRVLLRALFGAAPGAPAGRDAPAVTAVGDPCQSIYGWRGASAGNLPRFRTDFPGPDGALADEYGLLTSFRNPPEVLALANAVSAPLGAVPGAVGVRALQAGPRAVAGDVRVALLPDAAAELDWTAEVVAARWRAAADAGAEPPTSAVLVRRRADMDAVAAALRARDLPVEVVGLGGLLDTPEVRDLVSALRLVADPLAGPAAARLLTGARWRLGVGDLAALWARARELAPGPPSRAPASPAELALGALPGEHAEQAGLVDALDDPGEPGRYSPAGFARIRRLARELTRLRSRASVPLTDLVADAERLLLLDAETAARPGPVGRAHLDAFADVVADFAAGADVSTLPALLDYLDTAERAEDGLAPGEVDVAHGRVQVLTVHAAKGLEWEVVAVPHLVDRVFPGRKVSGSWLTDPSALPVPLRGDAADLPGLALPPPGADRRAVEEALTAHDDALDARRLVEERRLFYVAVTRAERVLLLSGHRWGATGERPREPSAFLEEAREAVGSAGVGRVEHWAPEPEPGVANPAVAEPATGEWPVDPLGSRSAAVHAGAELVRAVLRERAAPPSHPPDPGPHPGLSPDDPGPADPGGPGPEDPGSDPDGPDPEGWAADVDVLLAERAAAGEPSAVELPAQLSVSRLVELALDPAAFAARLRRPLPRPPSPHARRGTAFHAWLEQRFGAARLLDVDDLPGAADEGAASDELLEELQAAFLASGWAQRTPHDVEVPFETVVEGIAVRGRMDAVFADPDGGWTVVDWKTGALPDPDRRAALDVQLAAYRLAWAALAGCPPGRVRAAFHYVRHDVTLHPVDLLDADGLRALVAAVPVAAPPDRAAPDRTEPDPTAAAPAP